MKLKATDIRTGNLIQKDGKPYEIAPIGIFCLGKSHSGIPLTINWLRSKFIVTVEKQGLLDKIECRTEKSLFPTFTLFYSRHREDFKYAFNDMHISVGFKYVHKLQNLHYEIKGTELPIK